MPAGRSWRRFSCHTELHFAVRARRAADAALQRVLAGDSARHADSVEAPGKPLARTGEQAAPGHGRPGRQPDSHGRSGDNGRHPPATYAVATLSAAKSRATERDGNVAWLVNAQDCQWAEVESEMPGRDMRAGKLLRLASGAWPRSSSTGVRG